MGALVNLDPPVEDKFRFRSHSASPAAELSKTAAFAPRIASCGAAHKDRLSYTSGGALPVLRKESERREEEGGSPRATVSKTAPAMAFLDPLAKKATEMMSGMICVSTKLM